MTIKQRFIKLAFIRLISGIILAMAGAMSVYSAYRLISDALLSQVEKTYGSSARHRINRWEQLFESLQSSTDQQKLAGVNRFFNAMRFISDAEHWGKSDYWATPVEFIASNGGDCEDFSIAKYYTLRELGIPEERLYLTYVKALKLNQAHMVLAYFESPHQEPVVLDNLIDEIKKASLRKDLLPIYSFNAEGLWLAKERERGQLVGSSKRLSRWEELKKRLQTDGIAKALN